MEAEELRQRWIGSRVRIRWHEGAEEKEGAGTIEDLTSYSGYSWLVWVACDDHINRIVGPHQVLPL